MCTNFNSADCVGYTSSVSLTADSFSLAAKRPPFVTYGDISPAYRGNHLVEGGKSILPY